MINPRILARMHEVATAAIKEGRPYVVIERDWWHLFFSQMPRHWLFCDERLQLEHFLFRGIPFVRKQKY